MSKIHCFEFSALLQAQRRHLLEDVREQITASGERLGSANRTKIAEGDPLADAVAEMDVAMVIRESRELQETEAALARIRDGSYGICIDCGVEISRARLKADPTATRCPPCQILVLTILPTGER
jgi:DnaK suppressor protein